MYILYFFLILHYKKRKDTNISTIAGFKLYNTARNKSHFAVTILINIMICDYQNIIVYGDQRGLDKSAMQYRHFVGGFTLLKSIPTSANSQCKFVSESTEQWYYVFVKTFGEFELCEVIFEWKQHNNTSLCYLYIKCMVLSLFRTMVCNWFP